MKETTIPTPIPVMINSPNRQIMMINFVMGTNSDFVFLGLEN
jgi:hypothetical protein